MSRALSQCVMFSNFVLYVALAVDWISGNLYWTDAHMKHIEVANLSNKWRIVLISDDLEGPYDIAVDPRDG